MRLRHGILALVTAVILVPPVVAAQAGAGLQVQTSAAGISYVAGGVGKEENAAMNALYRNYSFMLLNVDKAQGGYVADVGVRITDKTGRQVLATTVDGPRLIANLPAGSYRLSASFGGHTQTRNIVIPASGHQREVLRWIASAKPAAAVSNYAPTQRLIPPEDRAAPASEAPETIVSGEQVKTIQDASGQPAAADVGSRRSAAPYHSPGPVYSGARSFLPPEDRAAPASEAPETIISGEQVKAIQDAPTRPAAAGFGIRRSEAPYYSPGPVYSGARSSLPPEDRAAPASAAPVTVIPGDRVKAIENRNVKPAIRRPVDSPAVGVQADQSDRIDRPYSGVSQ